MWLVGVETMEPFDEFWGVGELSTREPLVVFGTITDPFDEVAKAPASVFAVENLLDLVLLFAINDDRRRRWSSDTIVTSGAESVHVEHVVDAQMLGKLEAVIEIANPLENLERSELPGAKFGARLMQLYLLGGEPNHVSDVEDVRFVFVAFVVGFHPYFGHAEGSLGVFAGFFKAVKAFLQRWDVGTMTDRLVKVRLIAVDEFERGFACAFMTLGVECELSSGEVVCPVILLIVTEDVEVDFDVLVFALNFAVALGVVGGGESCFDAETFVQCTHEPSGELRASVGDDLARYAVQSENVAIMDISDTFSRELRCTGHQMSLVREVIDVDSDRVLATRSGELCDEINSNDFPWLSRDFLGLKVRVWMA